MPPDKIPGREKEITQLLRLLRAQSVFVEEMRRMGKSMLLLKLAHLCNSETLPQEFKGDKFSAQYFSFQGKQNLGELIDFLIAELEKPKAWYKIDFGKTYEVIRKLISAPQVAAGGATFSVNLPELRKSWKDIFYKVLDDIAEAQEQNNGILILIFDELPIMLWEWYKEKKHEEAMELLDILRERRQALEQKGIRFVYCGSIGIKIVLTTLKHEFGYSGEPTNEMAEFSLKPFSRAETEFLCECFLLSGFNTDTEKTECWAYIHEITSGLPFYIAYIFNLLQTEYDLIINKLNIEKAYQQILHDPNYHAAFKQLVDRLHIYYPAEKANCMIRILNQLSKTTDITEESFLFESTDINNRALFDDCIYTLYADHYVSREYLAESRHYQFRYQLFKTWWKINKA